MDNSRAARGAGVLLMAQAVRVLSNFGGLLILSRILSPTQFGIAAVAMLVVGIGEIIRDAGLATASVREASLTEGQRDALFWVSTSIGLLLAVVLLGVADLIAAAFRMPELGSLLRLLTLVFLANGFSSQYRATLNRQMRYKEMAIVDSVASVIGLVIAIIAALSGFGYWSLGYQVIGTAAVSSALLAAYGHWWPKLPQKGVKIGSVLRFGGSLLVSQIVAYAGN
ncbi:MAG: oligosaccharide flippase family protein, partial [Propionicimonas sp.]|nr:oligosaccharide flippase family protein [Propionicimonas sp.]